MFDRAIAQFRPRPRSRQLDWCKANVQTDLGRPYDHSAYPHIGAPGGPADAFDCPQYLTIWLQWASRLGKTFYGNSVAHELAIRFPTTIRLAFMAIIIEIVIGISAGSWPECGVGSSPTALSLSPLFS